MPESRSVVNWRTENEWDYKREWGKFGKVINIFIFVTAVLSLVHTDVKMYQNIYIKNAIECMFFNLQ